MPFPRLARLERAATQEPRLCVGVLSGTSADAAEAALCRIQGTGAQVRLELVAHRSLPFSRELQQQVLTADSARALCELNFVLGERFAEAVLSVIADAGLTPQDVDLVGSHGQTVAHWPQGLGRTPSTLQLGEASVIAERTGIPVVCDFRVRDVAAGGEGAPLVPYLDWALFRPPSARRALQNLGGIGNVSVVGEKLEDTVAFDTGPGNMVLDGLARRLTHDVGAMDRDGRLSSQGTVLTELLEELLALPFFHAYPPKSCGRETFGEPFIERLWAKAGQRPLDLLATAAALTVESVARAYERWALPQGPLEAVYLSGGGARNPTLVEGLTRRLAPLPVRPLTALGFREEAKEAACFALLASEWIQGTAQNVPRVTGARHPVVLGKLVP